MAAKKKTAAKKTVAKKTAAKKPAAKKSPRLLSGGNPQIAKGDGAAPVKAYLAALPDWKRAIATWVDRTVTKAVPKVQKAVKWNSPMYGLEGDGFFLGIHVFTHYVKLTFFTGQQLRPMPPGASKHPQVRYLDVRDGDVRDTKQLTAWAKQGAKIPGWKPGKK